VETQWVEWGGWVVRSVGGGVVNGGASFARTRR